jgi:hypothetical protein
VGLGEQLVYNREVVLRDVVFSRFEGRAELVEEADLFVERLI